MAGCVPVYFGARNISDYVPASCYIDRREFSSDKELYSYMESIDFLTYTQYQLEISNFLSSSASKKFDSVWFANTICDSIVEDLSIIK